MSGITLQQVQVAFDAHFSNISSIQNGVGGQGVVFRAVSRRDDTPIALKVYFPGALTERTDREIEALKRLRCPSLVNLHADGKVQIESDTCTFVATDFVEGLILSTAIKNSSMNLKLAARVARDIALAIDAIWKERIVHRDIKPSNIMLRERGGAVLIDLGVARHLALESLTTLGSTWGTLGYMSPEQARALRSLSCKSDIFALGIVLQECLFGRHPAGGNQRLLGNGGIATASLRIALPAEVLAFIDRLVAAAPHRRPLPLEVADFFSSYE